MQLDVDSNSTLAVKNGSLKIILVKLRCSWHIVETVPNLKNTNHFKLLYIVDQTVLNILAIESRNYWLIATLKAILRPHAIIFYFSWALKKVSFTSRNQAQALGLLLSKVQEGTILFLQLMRNTETIH